MKKATIFLLVMLACVCGKRAFDLRPSASEPSQCVSDHVMREAKLERLEGNDRFLVCDEMLYRFNREGEFVRRITDTTDIHVAGYVVNPANRQLIVLGNTDDIFYYNYEGELLERKKLRSDLSQEHTSLEMDSTFHTLRSQVVL